MSPAKVSSSIKLSYEKLILKTKHPFGISYGTQTDHPNLLVRLEFDGHEGLGECAPVGYHNESLATAEALLQQWQNEKIVGDNPFAIAELCARMDKSIAGNTSVKAAIEMAMHDLSGKILKQPVNRMLGLEGLKAPMTDFTIGIDSLDVVEKKTREAVSAGYKMLKVKQGTAYDKEIIKRVRKGAPDLPLRVDANGGWTPKQAIEMSKFLAENNVEFIEQPLPKHAHVDDWHFVRRHTAIPIFADESAGRAPDVVRLAGAIDGVVVKLSKTGGLLEALKLIYTARAHNLKIMFGMMIESSIGVTAAAHLAGLVDYLDLDGALLLASDPYQGAEYNDGYLDLPDRPGLGVIPRR
jgi:o-succinylbenzoate synthase